LGGEEWRAYRKMVMGNKGLKEVIAVMMRPVRD
jgi:hypothetical protein